MWKLKQQSQALLNSKIYFPPAISLRVRAVWNSNWHFSFLTWKPVSRNQLPPKNCTKIVPYLLHLSSEFQVTTFSFEVTTTSTSACRKIVVLARKKKNKKKHKTTSDAKRRGKHH